MLKQSVVNFASPSQSGFLLFGLLLALLLFAPGAALAQGANLAGSCPTACGLKVQIKDAVLNEANDGMLVKVEWTFTQTAPEIKLSGFTVLAEVSLGLDRVKNSLTVSSTQRSATIKLSRRFEFDFKDVKTLHTEVTALANPLPPVPITNILSRNVSGEGGDAQVSVSWNVPPPIACSAASFAVAVSAENAEGKKFTGNGEATLSARSASVKLTSSLTGRKNLRDPQATIILNHAPILCDDKRNFQPLLAVPRPEPLASGTGANAPNPVVTIKTITIQESSGRIDTRINWDVVEPPGFKARGFDLKFALEELDGRITSLNTTRNPSGNERSSSGPQLEVGKHRSLLVTITATFANNNNTTVLTREDKQTRGLVIRETPPEAKLSPPTTPKFDLTITKIKAISNGIETAWEAQAPAGVTLTGFDVEAQAGTIKNKLTVPGNERQAALKLNLAAAGTPKPKVQVKVTANGRQANGATFQQSVTREEFLVTVVPTPAPTPPPGQLGITQLTFIKDVNRFLFHGEWQIELPTGVSVNTFNIEATVIKSQGPVKQTAVAAGNLRKIDFAFNVTDGEAATSLELKVIANLKRADGSTFQQTATRGSN